ncbi:Txe/YoeB family addiction module toxin [Leuconostoc lactis]
MKRINKLITEILSSPFEGTGKPEPVKYELQGVWARRIDSANRLVYIVTDTEIQIIQVKYHY